MPVDHSHIVPAMYLREWADDDGHMETYLVNRGSQKRVPVKHAGVRGGGFYKRERPTGKRSDDIETVSLQSIENTAAPVLRELETRWPLTGDDKLAMAMLIALQLVRGPKFFDWHDQFTSENLSRYRDEGQFAPGPGVEASEEQIYEATLEQMLGSTERLMTMLRVTAKMASCVGSMTWSLIRFERPVLATSDHPVVVWPASETGRPAEPAVPGKIGVGNFFEVRFPVNPWAALLMAWRDRPDTMAPIAGKTHHADNLNAFTIAEAEHQWFYRPGSRRPRRRTGPWLPLAPELLLDYSIREAAGCRRRRDILADMQGRVGEEMEQSLRAEIRHIPYQGEPE